ncbi:unnamed protein product [Prorocentrum cordatum]|uniref:Uncharacterized protein n=1 Tax=Prorocentrum cordatum TaxID=2364126 RepID=A0ABN9UR70_9DINO|nr:unnamed protein product [Polarella glacialis]
MLGQGPSLMENSRTNCTYELSEPVEPSEKLDVFMSHTWTSDRFLKYVAILYHFNGHFSHVAAHFAALATFLVLLTVKVFTPWGVYMPVFHLPFPGNPTEYPEGMPLCGPVFFVGCVTQITTFAFGHVLFKTRSVYQQMIFLDKCCIHQTDPELKRRGIDYMGNFVTQSKTMFIPFDNARWRISNGCGAITSSPLFFVTRKVKLLTLSTSCRFRLQYLSLSTLFCASLASLASSSCWRSTTLFTNSGIRKVGSSTSPSGELEAR